MAVDENYHLSFPYLFEFEGGLFMCPEGAATVTAARELRRQGWLDATDEVVLLNTGAGTLYPDTVAVDVPVVSAAGPIVIDEGPSAAGISAGPGGMAG